MMVKIKATRVPAVTIRLTPEDEKLVGELKLRMGMVSNSDLFRQALRALATKEGMNQ